MSDAYEPTVLQSRLDPTTPGMAVQAAKGKWTVKILIGLNQVDADGVQRGAVQTEQIGEGPTPGEAYRAALEKVRPVVRAYKLEQGPLPLERE